MKINSENLWKYVNELATGEKVTFGVYYDDQYVTEILWNGDNFEWESGRFNSEAFFNPLYDFVVIRNNEDNKEIAGKKHAENNVNFEALINELRYCRELLKVEKKDKKLPKIEYIYKVDDEKQNANNEKFKDFINEVTDKLNEVLNEK